MPVRNLSANAYPVPLKNDLQPAPLCTKFLITQSLGKSKLCCLCCCYPETKPSNAYCRRSQLTASRREVSALRTCHVRPGLIIIQWPCGLASCFLFARRFFYGCGRMFAAWICSTVGLYTPPHKTYYLLMILRTYNQGATTYPTLGPTPLIVMKLRQTDERWQ